MIYGIQSVKSTFRQFFCVIVVQIGAFILGGWISFPSLALPKMMSNQTETTGFGLSIDRYSASWIVSIFSVGNIVGCFLGGYLNQLLGTKKCYIIIVAPVTVCSWVIIGFAERLWVILVSRVISGVIYGIIQANGKVYASEIADKNLRGSLGAILGCMFSLGNIFTYVTGYFITSWRTVAFLQVIPAIILWVFMLFLPESPYWLLQRGRLREARKALELLRGKDYEEELTEIIKKKESKNSEKNGVMTTLMSKRFLKPFLKISPMMILKDLAGMSIIGYYMVELFENTNMKVSPSLAPIIVCSNQLVFSIISVFILGIAKRKPLFLFCLLGLGVSLSSLGAYYFIIKVISIACNRSGQCQQKW